MGEPNSGKTTVVNFLLQSRLLLTDTLPDAPCPTLLRFDEGTLVRATGGDGSVTTHSLAELHRLRREPLSLIEVFLPSAILKKCEILDCPGLSGRGDLDRHASLIDCATAVIWCTVATQAWKASEKALWSALSFPKPNALLAVTHKDRVSTDQAHDIGERLSRETASLFADWVMLSAPAAILSCNPRGQVVDQRAWSESGADAFMKRLLHFIQQAISPGKAQAVVGPSELLLDESAPTSLAAGFAALREALKEAATADTSPAAALADHLLTFNAELLLPLLKGANLPTNEVEIIKRMVPTCAESLVPYFVDGDSAANRDQQAAILFQLEEEITERFRVCGIA